VSDDEILMHNFPQKPEKKVKVVYTFKRNATDSTWNLDGNWKTNLTKKYYAISGKSELKTEKDLSKSKIFPHLEELKQTADIAFYNEWKRQNENSVANKDNAFKQEFLKTLVKAEKERSSKAIEHAGTKPVSINTSAINTNNSIAIAPDEKKTDIEAAALGADKKDLSNKQQAKINATGISNPENIAIKADQKKTDIEAAQLGSERRDLSNKQQAQINTTGISNPENIAIKADQRKTENESVALGADKKDPANTQQAQVNTSVISNPENIAIKTDQKKTGIVAEQQNGGSAVLTDKDGYIISTPVNTKPAATAKSNPAEIKNNLPGNNPQTSTPASAPPEVKSISRVNIPVTNTGAAKEISEREFDKPAVIEFASDSLVLALYDNGEVDGDTVSVLLNGEVIIPRQCLKTVAFKKTIYISPEELQVNIVLYAENLGIYPPNTGLLVIFDGEDRHNVRFSADFKKNSAIILKRKRK
jgi:archaellum component FlaG (FlaF/FlaG flagellin family)